MTYNPSDSPNGVLAQFDAWSNRLLEAKNWQSKQPLYHYTCLETLPKILKSKHLWMTSLFNQPKDPQEFSFGLNVFKSVLQEHRQAVMQGSMNDQLLTRLGELANCEFQEHWGCHIACVAPHGEDFDLWANFADKGRGVAIKIAPEFFATRPPAEGEPKWFVQPVTYGHDVAAHAFRKVIQVALMSLAEAEKLVITLTEQKIAVNSIFQSLAAGHIIPICMVSKSGDFIAEAEVRILAPFSIIGQSTTKGIVMADFPHKFIEGILVGENADLDCARNIVTQFGLSPDLIKVAAYSRCDI